MKDLIKAKKLLTNDIRLVMIKDDEIIKSKEEGISFLFSLAAAEKYQGFSAADKIVGKAAAFLYCRMKIKNVYGETISKKAIDILEEAKIHVEYKILTDSIFNRTNTGLCPMELKVLDVEDKDEAYLVLKEMFEQ
ncbi:MAG: DUF1893 domain-containing protein [Erysipelotrichaceae bacterium]|jgi:hypothetical protein